MEATEHAMTSWDGAELFYRAWIPCERTDKAILLFHRGHEHSGRDEKVKSPYRSFRKESTLDRTARRRPNSSWHAQSLPLLSPNSFTARCNSAAIAQISILFALRDE